MRRLGAAYLIMIGVFCLVILVYVERDLTYTHLAMLVPGWKKKLPETRQVVFAKVHKAASSTVQNILLRFATARNLSVLLPKVGYNFENESTLSRAKILPHPEGKEKFDILCIHVLYDSLQIANFFPENAVRVAILREPLNQTLSALKYYSTVYSKSQLIKGLQKHPTDPINGFLQHPEDFYNEKGNSLESFVNNRMSLDLGFPSSLLDCCKNNTEMRQRFIEQVESEFDLVLISDYFDESMVLLKRYLRWSLKDIIYLESNKAKQRSRFSPFGHKPNLTSEITEAFRAWDIIDYELYEYFLLIFQKKIESEYRFQDEFETFKEIRERVVNFCSDNAKHNLTVSENSWTDEFILLKSDCILMNTSELPFIDFVKQEQMKRYQQFQDNLSLSTGLPSNNSLHQIYETNRVN